MLKNKGFTTIVEYLDNKIEVAQADITEFKRIKEPGLAKVAKMWEDFYGGALDAFNNKYKRDVVKAFADYQRQGHIEIITCGATHGYFRFSRATRASQAQVKQAVASYRRNYGRKPKGHVASGVRVPAGIQMDRPRALAGP